MTVQELILLLQEQPQDAEVVMQTPDADNDTAGVTDIDYFEASGDEDEYFELENRYGNQSWDRAVVIYGV